MLNVGILHALAAQIVIGIEHQIQRIVNFVNQMFPCFKMIAVGEETINQEKVRTIFRFVDLLNSKVQ